VKFAIHKLRFLIALALIFWCAGTGCMIVSYAHVAGMNGADTTSPQPVAHDLTGASGSIGSHTCCKAHHASANQNQANSRPESSTESRQVWLPQAPTPSGANSCCPLTTGSFAVASRTNANDDNNSASSQTDSLVLAPSTTRPAFRAYPLRLLNQDRTYLRVCVFLI